MKVHISNAILLASLLLVLMPVASRAQWNSCEVFYCTSYATYDTSSNIVSAYAQYYDPTGYYFIGIDATLQDSDYTDVGSCDSGSGWSTVTANCSWTAAYNGNVWITGYPWYEDGGDFYDGSTYNFVGVLRMPTGESVSSHSIISGGAIFYLTLLPTSFNFDGYYIQEGLSGFSDTCHPEYPLGPTLSAPTPAGPGLVTGASAYQDTVQTSYSYLSTYLTQAQAANIADCGWSLSQSMSYAGSNYIAGQSMGQSINSSGAYTYRASASYLNFSSP